jgi:hypothetical protein
MRCAKIPSITDLDVNVRKPANSISYQVRSMGGTFIGSNRDSGALGLGRKQCSLPTGARAHVKPDLIRSNRAASRECERREL